MPTQPDTVLHVRAPADLVRLIDGIAQATERTRNYVARKLLEQSLTGEDRMQALQAIAAAGLDDYAANAKRGRAPNATALIAEASVEGHARLRALNKIAKGAR